MLTLDDRDKPQLQVGLFLLKKDGNPHIIEYDCSEVKVTPQLDINFDFDTDGSILGPKEVIDNQLTTCKQTWDYKYKTNFLSYVCESISKKYPNDTIELLVISCRVFQNVNLDKAIRQEPGIERFYESVAEEYDRLFHEINNTTAQLNMIPQNLKDSTLKNKQTLDGYIAQLVDTHPRILEEPALKNKFYTSYQNIFNQIDEIIKSVSNMPIDIQQSFNQSKKSLDDNLNLLISRLAERGSLIKTGYGEMQDFSIDIALEDHLNKKPIITPPTNLNYYIPNSPGNQQMRSLIFKSR